MGENFQADFVNGVFPQPMELNSESASSIPPNWAIAIIAAASGVTLLWGIAIFVLVNIFYHLAEKHSSYLYNISCRFWLKFIASQDMYLLEIRNHLLHSTL